MKESTERTMNSNKNTFMNVYFWIKSEMMDLEAMQNCINERNRLVDMKQKISTKQRNHETRLNTLATGKSSFKNLFKSKSSKENETETLKLMVTQATTEIQNYTKIINVINQYIAEKAIPFFKNDKMRNYYSMLDILCNQELNNCNVNTSYWQMVQGQVSYSQY